MGYSGSCKNLSRKHTNESQSEETDLRPSPKKVSQIQHKSLKLCPHAGVSPGRTRAQVCPPGKTIEPRPHINCWISGWERQPLTLTPTLSAALTRGRGPGLVLGQPRQGCLAQRRGHENRVCLRTTARGVLGTSEIDGEGAGALASPLPERMLNVHISHWFYRLAQPPCTEGDGQCRLEAGPRLQPLGRKHGGELSLSSPGCSPTRLLTRPVFYVILELFFHLILPHLTTPKSSPDNLRLPESLSFGCGWSGICCRRFKPQWWRHPQDGTRPVHWLTHPQRSQIIFFKRSILYWL